MTWPLVAYFAFVVVLVAAVLLVSYLLGQRHSEPATGEPYEGGIVSEGSARVRFSVRYYLVAMFFVVLDLEAVFLFAWAGVPGIVLTSLASGHGKDAATVFGRPGGDG